MDLQRDVEAECWAFGCCQELCGGSQLEHGASPWDGQATSPAVHWDSGLLPVTRTEESQDLQGSSGRPWGVQTSFRCWNNLPKGRKAGPPYPTPVPGKIGLKGPARHMNKPPSVKAVCLHSVGRPLPHLCTVKRPLLITWIQERPHQPVPLGPRCTITPLCHWWGRRLLSALGPQFLIPPPPSVFSGLLSVPSLSAVLKGE